MRWLQQLFKGLTMDNSKKFEIVTIGFDGKERVLQPKYDTGISALLDARYYETIYRPVPFQPRQCKQ